jgi:hypothetical protein
MLRFQTYARHHAFVVEHKIKKQDEGENEKHGAPFVLCGPLRNLFQKAFRLDIPVKLFRHPMCSHGNRIYRYHSFFG